MDSKIMFPCISQPQYSLLNCNLAVSLTSTRDLKNLNSSFNLHIDLCHFVKICPAVIGLQEVYGVPKFCTFDLDLDIVNQSLVEFSPLVLRYRPNKHYGTHNQTHSLAVVLNDVMPPLMPLGGSRHKIVA